MSEPDRIDGFTQITTHVADGLAAFYRQFSNTKLKAIAAAWLSQVQDVENAAWAVLTQTTIDNAADASLDQIGVLLGLGRGLLDNTSYRAVLRAIVYARRCAGGPEDLMQTARLALGAITFRYDEGAASAYITVESAITFAPALLFVLRLARDAGVQMQVVYLTQAPAATFTFAPGLVALSSATQGLADVALTRGGHMTGVVS